jgi:hypothetical protein
LRQKSFVRYLDPDNRVRISFQVDRGKIKRFVAQYESFLDAEWHPIIRYDTAHGFAHADLFRPSGKAEKIPMQTKDFSEAFTLAQEDISRNWELYLKHYLREKKG